VDIYDVGAGPAGDLGLVLQFLYRGARDLFGRGAEQYELVRVEGQPHPQFFGQRAAAPEILYYGRTARQVLQAVAGRGMRLKRKYLAVYPEIAYAVGGAVSDGAAQSGGVVAAYPRELLRAGGRSQLHQVKRGGRAEGYRLGVELAAEPQSYHPGI
jgi:hypothetical protein